MHAALLASSKTHMATAAVTVGVAPWAGVNQHSSSTITGSNTLQLALLPATDEAGKGQGRTR